MIIPRKVKKIPAYRNNAKNVFGAFENGLRWRIFRARAVSVSECKSENFSEKVLVHFPQYFGDFWK
jgi:hypothetical protein